MDVEVFWNALKWVLVVVAAGFVGQFGRHLAKMILERRRQARLDAEQVQSKRAGDGELERVKMELEAKKAKDQAKLEKKQAKAEVKRAKKKEE